jgi:hypothetical protein
MTEFLNAFNAMSIYGVLSIAFLMLFLAYFLSQTKAVKTNIVSWEKDDNNDRCTDGSCPVDKKLRRQELIIDEFLSFKTDISSRLESFKVNMNKIFREAIIEFMKMNGFPHEGIGKHYIVREYMLMLRLSFKEVVVKELIRLVSRNGHPPTSGNDLKNVRMDFLLYAKTKALLVLEMSESFCDSEWDNEIDREKYKEYLRTGGYEAKAIDECARLLLDIITKRDQVISYFSTEYRNLFSNKEQCKKQVEDTWKKLFQ